jgi:hypothetical protein
MKRERERGRERDRIMRSYENSKRKKRRRISLYFCVRVLLTCFFRKERILISSRKGRKEKERGRERERE